MEYLLLKVYIRIYKDLQWILNQIALEDDIVLDSKNFAQHGGNTAILLEHGPGTVKIAPKTSRIKAVVITSASLICHYRSS
jgi:hypothetical protein